MEILKKIWKKQAENCDSKPYFCISTKRGDSWKDHYIKWPNFTDLDNLLKAHPTDKYNLYFCPLPLRRPHRRKEYVFGSAFLWADIDETDPLKMTPAPHILWESSPGRWAGLWTMERWLLPDQLEKYNKQMTYGTNSDKAGWDLTQVLRIPGTRNHKYKGSPEGRLVKTDFKSLLALKDVPKDISRKTEGQTLEIYKKWQSKLSANARAILRAPSISDDQDRSKILWKLYHLLFSAGVPVNEISALVKGSVWNRFATKPDGRPNQNEDRDLAKDIERCLEKKLDAAAEKRGSPVLAKKDSWYDNAIHYDKIKRKEPKWLWYPYISYGALTIIQGVPDAGKSYVTQMIAQAVCDGGSLPSEYELSGKVKIPAGPVIYFTKEEEADIDVKPRLEDNNMKNFANLLGYDKIFQMSDESLEKIMTLIQQWKSPSLIIFDTLSYYIGAINMNQANEVSQAMDPFLELAQRTGAAVVMVSHIPKSTQSDRAIDSVMGSRSFAGTCRHILAVNESPDDPDLRLFSVVKLNRAKKPKTLGYRISEVKRGSSKFTWEEEFFDITSNQLQQARAGINKGRPPSVGPHAEEFILAAFKNQTEIKASLINTSAAEARGISPSTMHRAKEKLGVTTIKRGETWYCVLPLH